MLKQDLTVYDPYPEGSESTDIYLNKVGQTYFEINNYLGNVNAVITDRKSANWTPSSSNASTWEAAVMNTSDYYPLGMQMPGRVNSYGAGVEYRYAYNGMELDNEVSGNGNSYTTEFRQYDPRLGRWKSLDPLMHKFPWMSPYVAFDDNPVFYTDPWGLESEGPGDPPVGESCEDEQGCTRIWAGEDDQWVSPEEIPGVVAKNDMKIQQLEAIQIQGKKIEKQILFETKIEARIESYQKDIRNDMKDIENRIIGIDNHLDNFRSQNQESEFNKSLSVKYEGATVKQLNSQKVTASPYTLEVSSNSTILNGTSNSTVTLDLYGNVKSVSSPLGSIGTMSAGPKGGEFLLVQII